MAAQGHSDNTATLTCTDGDDRIVFSKRIEYTDFPLRKSPSTLPTTSSSCRASIDRVLCP